MTCEAMRNGAETEMPKEVRQDLEACMVPVTTDEALSPAGLRAMADRMENEMITPDTKVGECGNCGREWCDFDLRPIKDLEQRVSPGEPMPLGECPRCGALVTPVDDLEPGEVDGQDTAEQTPDQIIENLGEIIADLENRGLDTQLQAAWQAREIVRESTTIKPPVQTPPVTLPKKGFTVLLLYPDYMNETGHDTYCEYNDGATVEQAISLARARVAAEHGDGPDPLDFAVLAVFEGDTGWDLREG